ncbi:MAG: FAD-dependent oxidoreductase, partial [Alphaproteobacteria bacterium]|nr:FAD-dependent oxidoreductase [Alphaproteobacteria bacterium]
GGQEMHYRAPLVINAAGPWSRTFARRCSGDVPRLFPHGVLVWNLLLDRPQLASCAVAVRSAKRSGHTYFLVPWRGQLLAGTGHQPIPAGELRPPNRAEIVGMVDALNDAVPELNLSMKEVAKVFHGVMPGDPTGNLGSRPVLVDHGAEGGVKGFYSLSGVKYTTARAVADQTLRRLFPAAKARRYGEDFVRPAAGAIRANLPGLDETAALKRMIEEESVWRLADLVLRRGERRDAELSSSALEGLMELVPQGTGGPDQIHEVREQTGLPWTST